VELKGFNLDLLATAALTDASGAEIAGTFAGPGGTSRTISFPKTAVEAKKGATLDFSFKTTGNSFLGGPKVKIQ
jgi:hypothetical protein